MIVEHRMYTLHPGRVQPYLEFYEAEGLAIQEPILGNLVGYFSSEIGVLNRIIHLWGYDSLEERMRRRAVLAADPRWQAFAAQQRENIRDQESTILTPAPFSPIR